MPGYEWLNRLNKVVGHEKYEEAQKVLWLRMEEITLKLMESERPEENPYAPLDDSETCTTSGTSNVGRNFAIFLFVSYALVFLRVAIIASMPMNARGVTRARILGSLTACFIGLSLFSARQFHKRRPSARWWLAFSSLPFAIGFATAVWVLLVGSD